jgi:hypothetical protein
MRSRVRLCSIVALSFASGGCTRFIQGRGGFAMGSAARPTAAFDLNVGYGPGRERGAIGVDLGARAKFNSVLSSGAVSTSVWAGGNRGRFLFFGYGGVNLFQLDAIGGTVYAGGFSPFMSLGVGVNVSRVWGGRESGQLFSAMESDINTVALTLSASAEYNVRFATAGESFFSVLLGVAFMRAMSESRDAASETQAPASSETPAPTSSETPAPTSSASAVSDGASGDASSLP